MAKIKGTRTTVDTVHIDVEAKELYEVFKEWVGKIYDLPRHNHWSVKLDEKTGVQYIEESWEGFGGSHSWTDRARRRDATPCDTILHNVLDDMYRAVQRGDIK